MNYQKGMQGKEPESEDPEMAAMQRLARDKREKEEEVREANTYTPILYGLPEVPLRTVQEVQQENMEDDRRAGFRDWHVMKSFTHAANAAATAARKAVDIPSAAAHSAATKWRAHVGAAERTQARVHSVTDTPASAAAAGQAGQHEQSARPQRQQEFACSRDIDSANRHSLDPVEPQALASGGGGGGRQLSSIDSGKTWVVGADSGKQWVVGVGSGQLRKSDSSDASRPHAWQACSKGSPRHIADKQGPPSLSKAGHQNSIMPPADALLPATAKRLPSFPDLNEDDEVGIAAMTPQQRLSSLQPMRRHLSLTMVGFRCDALCCNPGPDECVSCSLESWQLLPLTLCLLHILEGKMSGCFELPVRPDSITTRQHMSGRVHGIRQAVLRSACPLNMYQHTNKHAPPPPGTRSNKDHTLAYKLTSTHPSPCTHSSCVTMRST